MKYVAGFLFNEFEEVLLVRKIKPKWQEGLLNGIGGKIEENENPYEAIHREFEEEVGRVRNTGWKLFHTLYFQENTVYFFRSNSMEDLEIKDGAINDVGEMLELVGVERLIGSNCIPNLTWLVPMALLDEGYISGVSNAD